MKISGTEFFQPQMITDAHGFNSEQRTQGTQSLPLLLLEHGEDRGEKPKSSLRSFLASEVFATPYSPVMRTPILTLVAIAMLMCVSGCRDRSTKLGSITNQALLKQASELENSVLMAIILNSLEKETYSTNVLERFRSDFNEAIVTKLVAEAPSELRRKLETLGRDTNRHPFTEEQLREALRRKERKE